MTVFLWMGSRWAMILAKANGFRSPVAGSGKVEERRTRAFMEVFPGRRLCVPRAVGGTSNVFECRALKDGSRSKVTLR